MLAKEIGTTVYAECRNRIQNVRRDIGQREFARLVEASGVRRIKFHGLRHTSATLALKAGVPVKVVAQRLGHAKTDISSTSTLTRFRRCRRTRRPRWRRC